MTLAIYDTGVHEGSPYLVSELLDGESLRSRLRAGKLSPQRALDYARQLARGLAASLAVEIWPAQPLCKKTHCAREARWSKATRNSRYCLPATPRWRSCAAI